MNNVATIEINEVDGRYYCKFILYNEVAEQCGYKSGTWVTKRLYKDNMISLYNLLRKKHNLFTVGDVINTMNKKQKLVLLFLVGQAIIEKNKEAQYDN